MPCEPISNYIVLMHQYLGNRGVLTFQFQTLQVDIIQLKNYVFIAASKSYNKFLLYSSGLVYELSTRYRADELRAGNLTFLFV